MIIKASNSFFSFDLKRSLMPLKGYGHYFQKLVAWILIFSTLNMHCALAGGEKGLCSDNNSALHHRTSLAQPHSFLHESQATAKESISGLCPSGAKSQYGDTTGAESIPGGTNRILEDDLVIHSENDIHLDHLLLKGKLNIRTAGKVTFGENCVVEGNAQVVGQRGVVFTDKTKFGGAVDVISSAEILQKGHIFSTGPMRLKGKVRNLGDIITEGLFHVEGEFYNRRHGILKANHSTNIQRLLDHNFGRIEILSDLVTQDALHIKSGHFVTKGTLQFGGDSFTIGKRGKVSLLQGGLFNTAVFINDGLFEVLGSGLEGRIGDFLLQGAANVDKVNMQVDNFNIAQEGTLHTRTTFNLLANKSFVHKGELRTRGIHNVDVKGFYNDDGVTYSPNLFVLKAESILYGSKHRSHLQDAILSSGGGVTVQKGASFSFWGPEYYFDLLGSNVHFEGRLSHDATRVFPLDSFQKMSLGVDPQTIRDIRREIQELRCMEWVSRRSAAPVRISLRSHGDLVCKRAVIHPQSGSVNLIADGKVDLGDSDVAGGYFKGNHLQAKGRLIEFEDSIFHSYLGDARVWGGSVRVKGTNVDSSSAFAQVIGDESLFLEDSTLSGAEGTLISSKGTTQIDNINLRGKRNVIIGEVSDIASTRFLGATSVASRALTLQDPYIEGSLSTEAKTTHLLGSIRGDGIECVAEHIYDYSDASVLNAHFFATKHFVDTPDTRTQVRSEFVLFAPHTKGFRGKVIAEGKATLRLHSMVLQDLLGQVNAPAVVADIGVSDVIFEQDAVIDPHLTLFARSFENQEHLRTKGYFHGYFKAHVNNHGGMTFGEEGILQAQGPIVTADIKSGKALTIWTKSDLEGQGVLEGDSVSIDALTARIITPVVRKSTLEGFDEYVSETPFGIRARNGDLNLTGRRWLDVRGALFQSKSGTVHISAPRIYLGSQEIKRLFHIKYGDSYHSHQSSQHHKSMLEGGKGVYLRAAGVGGSLPYLVLEGVDMESSQGGIHVYSAGGSQNLTVHNTTQEEIRSSHRGGVLRKKKTKKELTSTRTVLLNRFRAAKNISLVAEGDLHQWPIAGVTQEGGIQIHSLQGKVFMHADKSHRFYSKSRTSRSLVWQSQSQRGSYGEHGVVSSLVAPRGVDIHGAEGIEIEILGDNLASAKKRLMGRSEVLWVNGLENKSGVRWVPISESHRQWNEKAEGLTPVASALIAIAVSCATGGAGGAAIAPGLTAAGIEGIAAVSLTAAANASVSSLASQAAITAISNKGNVRSVVRDLSSSQLVRSLITTMIVSGVSAGLTDAFKVNLGTGAAPQSIFDRIQEQFIHAGVGVTFEALVGDESLRHVLVSHVRGSISNIIGGALAHEVGLEYKGIDSSLNYFTHKVFHAAIGAAVGLISENDPLSGAIGAFVGEVVGELYQDHLLSRNALLNTPDLFNSSPKGIALSQLSGAFFAGLLSQDPYLASRTARNAVVENAFFIPLIVWGVCAGMTAYEGYDIYKTYKNEGMRAAGFKLAEAGVITVVTLGAGKVFYKLGRTFYPSLKSMFASLEGQGMLLRKGGQQSLSFGRKSNIVESLRLKTVLYLQEGGLLTSNGVLTGSAVAQSVPIPLSHGVIRNPLIVKQLIRDGSKITDWKKYKTPTVNGPHNSRIQIHYYKNKVTGKIDYVTKDFKVKEVIPSF